MDTKKYSPRLTEEERQELAKYQHSFDYELSDEQLSFLEQHGYLVLRKIIPEEKIDQLVQEALSGIRQAGVDINDPSTWSNIPFHGCFDIWHTKTYNELRQNPLLYSIFAQLLKTHNLTVSVDRINLKAPCTSEAKSEELRQANANLELHTDGNYWHMDPDQPIYQGGLCLQDCPIGGGGFFALPGFQNPDRVRAYMHDVNRGKFGAPSRTVPKKGKSFVSYLDQKDANLNKVEVPMEKGDFVIWNNNLPHNGGKNSLMMIKNAPKGSLENFRMHCFIMFVPLDGPCASEEIASFYRNYRDDTRHSIMTGQRPIHFATRNRIGSGSNTKSKTEACGKITQLGERILGMTPWEVPEEEEYNDEQELC